MKKILFLLASLILLPLVASADLGGMMGCGSNWSGMMGGAGMWGMGFLGLIYLALAAFVFAVIFWLVYNWLVKK